MIFTARINRNSAIERNWRNHGKIGGHIQGVQFKKRANMQYTTDDLDKDSAQLLMGIVGVSVEMFGGLPSVTPHSQVEPPAVSEAALEAPEPKELHPEVSRQQVRSTSQPLLYDAAGQKRPPGRPPGSSTLSLNNINRR